MKTKEKILLSFVGKNDAGKSFNKHAKNITNKKIKYEGTILTALENEKFDKLYLIWNDSPTDGVDYSSIVDYVTEKASGEKYHYVKRVSNHKMSIKNVTDYNEIYKLLLAFTNELPKGPSLQYTAGIASGTPAMQVCWVLLAESGDFSEQYPLRLIYTDNPNDYKGRSTNNVRKLDITLPKILSMRNNIKALLPEATLNCPKQTLTIDDEIEVIFNPMETCYYRYFAELLNSNPKNLKFTTQWVPKNIMRKIYDYHKESFEALELNREEFKKILDGKSDIGIGIGTFRGHRTEINRKIGEALNNQALIQAFQIFSIGKRGNKVYGIDENTRGKIKIIP